MVVQTKLVSSFLLVLALMILVSCHISKEITYDQNGKRSSIDVSYAYQRKPLIKNKTKTYANGILVERMKWIIDTNGCWEELIFEKTIYYDSLSGKRVSKEVFRNYNDEKRLKQKMRRLRRQR